MKRPDRKPTRLKAYDYSSPGSYFITICTKDRKSILSKIIVGDGVLDVPENKLTHYGKTSDRIICEMNDFYNHISVDKYVIMPNHIHLLLTISATDDDITSGMSGTPSPTNSHISKFISTFKKNQKYTAKQFYEWHHRLTGSCEMGRKSFMADHNITFEDEMTVDEFIELCKNSYGGDIIRQLEERWTN